MVKEFYAFNDALHGYTHLMAIGRRDRSSIAIVECAFIGHCDLREAIQVAAHRNSIDWLCSHPATLTFFIVHNLFASLHLPELNLSEWQYLFIPLLFSSLLILFKSGSVRNWFRDKCWSLNWWAQSRMWSVKKNIHKLTTAADDHERIVCVQLVCCVDAYGSRLNDSRK